MLHDDTAEFLNANSLRTYPFAEGASMGDTLGGYTLPEGAVLDLVGFSRQEVTTPETAVRLAGLVGPNAAPLAGVYDVDAAGWKLVFSTGCKKQSDGTEQHLAVVVPDADGLTWAQRDVEVVVPSEFGQSPGAFPETGKQDATPGQYEYLAASLRVVVGEDFASLMPADDTSRLYFDGGEVEPGVFHRIWQTDIERLAVEDAGGTIVDVAGDVILRPGYNMSIGISGDSVHLSPSLGAGLGTEPVLDHEPYQDVETLMDECIGNILSINGARPDENYEFKIIGEDGVIVNSYPGDHQIIIDVVPAEDVTICPEEEPGV